MSKKIVSFAKRFFPVLGILLALLIDKVIPNSKNIIKAWEKDYWQKGKFCCNQID